MAALLVASGASFAATPVATAAPGDIIRSFTAEIPACSVGVGIAFNGTELLVSCANSNILSGVNTTDGRPTRSYTVTGLGGIGAIAFDRAGDQVWACDAASEDVYTVDLATGSSQRRFESDGCFDGLAYDATDGTLWAGGDVSSTITHFSQAGTVLGTINVGGRLNGCGKSGLAAGQSELFVANNGCSEVFRMSKDGADLTRIGTYPARIEDLECDDVTFPGTSVIWTKDAYDGVLNAFDVGSVNCGINAYRDSDADGISDDWESHPIDTNGDGTADLDLPAMGANPLHKDFFVEIDWLTKEPRRIGPISLGGGYNHQPSTTAVNQVVSAFRNWPVPNPDGQQGINLHMDGGPDTIMNPVTSEKWSSRSRANGIGNATPPSEWTDWQPLDALRTQNVDTARRGIFHYVLYVDDLGCSPSGCTTGISRGIPGHDLLIARGKIDTDTQEGVTLAHELGHNLGLGHGGRERRDDPGSRYVNEKANYLSIMNYFYSNTGLQTNAGTGAIITYSSRELDPLHRDALEEAGGLTPDPFGHFRVKYRCPNNSKRDGDSWTAIDWNCDGTVQDGSKNPNIQNPADVAEWKADPLRSLGSEDFNHLYFWGTGATWDARNVAVVDFNQPGTAEPTVEKAKADNVWWPDLALVSTTNVDLIAYPNTGIVDIPLSFTNQGGSPLTVRPQLTADPRFTTAASGDVTIESAASKEVRLRFDTNGVSAPGTYAATLELGHNDAGVLGSTRVAVKIPTPGDIGASGCAQAREARNAADLRPYQAPALDAYLATCQQASVTIDIKPGDNQNVINTKSMGKVPVAILGTAAFNPLKTVNPKSLTFGLNGTERSLATCDTRRGEDVNRDGHLDMVCHFETRLTGLGTTSTQATMRGQLTNGTQFSASDKVRVIKPNGSCKFS
ncbi:YncE family protein [Lentzea aerocolonigenes]|uniref:YncE family protein n=1 Tax=Lentzea aerocolonigenes TaxID=68170 RepID=UPI0004C3C89F|nr:hypothetical protein [Lentzea aerocolonigenes]MCP2242474.1 hypothetical protein [Lentzea aerocolonigenes]